MFGSGGSRRYPAPIVLLVLILAGLMQPVALAAKKADLVVTSLSAPGQVTAGDDLVVTDVTKNVGNKRAVVSRTAIFLSDDDKKSAGDTKLGTRKVPSLAPGTKSQATTKMTLATSILAGRYYVIACGDANNQVGESNEKNNCRPSQSKVRVKAVVLPEISIEGPEMTIIEGQTADFTVELDEASAKTVKVGYEDIPDSATTPDDYMGVSGTLTFSPGQTTKVVTVQSNVDDVIEETEHFLVGLMNPTNAVLALADDMAVGGIGDDPLNHLGFIAFQRNVTGTHSIWTVTTDGSEPVPREHAGQDEDPDWGHDEDADKLYFSSKGDEADRDLYVMNVTTGVVTKVADLLGDQHAPTISTGGTRLAFHSDADLTGDNPEGDFEIFVRTMASGEIDQVTDNDVADLRPDWHPTAPAALVYTSGDLTRDLWLITDVTNAAPVEIKNTPGIDEANPVWAPNGSTIAFDADEHGSRDIYFFRTGTAAIQQVTKEPGDETMPTFSPEGQRLAYVDSQDEAIVEFDIASCNETPLTSDPLVEDVAPDWNDPGDAPGLPIPDSGCFSGVDLPIEDDIVFISDGEAGAPNVFSIHPTGGLKTNVTRSLTAESDVVWDGQGSQVALVRGDKLFVKDAATGAATRVASFLEGDFSGVTWHPDEPILAFGYKGSYPGGDSTNDFDILVHDLREPTDVHVVSATGDSANDHLPDWSPDGSTVAFVSDKHSGPAYSLYTRSVTLNDPDGSPSWVGDNEERLTELAFDVSGPDWSPDGADIVFSSRHPGDAALDTELYAIAVSNGTVHRLTNDAAYHKDPAWSPDFQKLIWAYDASGSGFELVSYNLVTCTPAGLPGSSGVLEGPDWRPDGSAVVVPNYRSCPGVTVVPGTGP